MRTVVAALERLRDIPPTEVTFDLEATEVWKAFYVDWKSRVRDLNPLTAAATKRLDVYAVKLVETYAALENTLPLVRGNQAYAATKGRGRVWRSRCRVAHPPTPAALGTGGLRAGRPRRARRRPLPVWKLHHEVGGRYTAEEVHRAVSALTRVGEIEVVGRTKRRKDVYGLASQAGEA